MSIRFSKYQGLGNDFVIVDHTGNTDVSITLSRAAEICDRRYSTCRWVVEEGWWCQDCSIYDLNWYCYLMKEYSLLSPTFNKFVLDEVSERMG
jgi:hypothetical protein